MRKTFWCAALLGTGLVAAVAISAAPPHGPGHVPPTGRVHGPGHVPPADCPLGGHGPCGGFMAMMHQALHELNLTDAQREAVHETLIARRTDIESAVKPVIEAKRALHNAVLADDPDDAAIRTAAATLGTSIGDAAITFSNIRVEVFENARLTPEQMQKFAEFRSSADAKIDTFLNERFSAFLNEHFRE
jgi:Spy/CpxP family protein refolding chaperone